MTDASPTRHGKTWEQELAALIARVGQGDQAAFTAFYDATSSRVYGMVLRILSDQSAAEDVTIEVYMQVHQQASRYKPERGMPSAWLLTLARSRAIDHLRRTSAQQRWEAPLETTAIPSPMPGPEACSATSEIQHAVKAALATLSQEQRQVIEIAYYTGVSHAEIAIQLGQPLGTVKSRIRTGMNMLRNHLRPLLAEHECGMRNAEYGMRNVRGKHGRWQYLAQL